jgi:hypothetical protein
MILAGMEEIKVDGNNPNLQKRSQIAGTRLAIVGDGISNSL